MYNASNSTLNAIDLSSYASTPQAVSAYANSVVTVMNSILDIDVPRHSFAPRDVSSDSMLLGYAEKKKSIHTDAFKVLTNNFAVDNHGNMFWVRGFGGQRFQHENDTTSTNFGVAMGVDHQLGEQRISVLFGVGHVTNASNDDSQKIDGDTGFGGVYVASPLGAFDLDEFVIGDGMYSQTKRSITVNGAGETAEGKFTGY
ncbi:autotransporter domain-containing protein [Breoghania sp.]|uniref:autotransporter domain-containing protein n=1 Tax=Breoghania sp. TaxID=2065378 RepID=UPI0026084F39|nr:autotransporter domain-containing protein [Breoghania sp.]MDJ0930612.1 autotransporter domain-containing protein [Breoghania sp.]